MENIFILNLETSAVACTVSIAESGRLLAAQASDGDFKHSKEITLLINNCLSQANITINQLAAVAISGGPGSYTGLRVAASAAKGICYALNIPLLAVETLKIVAIKHIKNLKKGGFIIPMIDARRDEVYYNIYDSELNPQIETTNLILNEESLKIYRNKECLVCGNAAEKAQNLLKADNFIFINESAQAENMVKLSFNKYQSKSFENIAYYSPFYLKPPNITKSKKQLF